MVSCPITGSCSFDFPEQAFLTVRRLTTVLHLNDKCGISVNEKEATETTSLKAVRGNCDKTIVYVCSLIVFK